MAALLIALLCVPVYYLLYRRAPQPKQDRSLGLYLLAAFAAGWIGFVVGTAIGITAACFAEDAGNLCGLAGIFGTGPIAAMLATLIYAHLWYRSARLG